MRPLIILAALSVGACAVSPQVAAVSEAGLVIARKASDDALETYERGICEWATAGALTRRYGQRPRQAQGRALLCAPDTFDPVVTR